MHWKLFADLAEIVGDREVEIDLAVDEPTVGDGLAALVHSYPDLEARILTDEGELEDHLNLLKNGENVQNETGLSTPLEAGDELALFPPVSGG